MYVAWKTTESHIEKKKNRLYFFGRNTMGGYTRSWYNRSRRRWPRRTASNRTSSSQQATHFKLVVRGLPEVVKAVDCQLAVGIQSGFIICYEFVLADMLSAVYSMFSSDTLSEILEEFKEKMEDGDEDIGIPVLEPFESDRLDIDLNEDGLFSATGRVRDLRIDGLSNYTVKRADFPMPGFRAKVILLFHKIKIETQYRMEGTFLDDNSFDGRGSLALVIKRLKVTMDLQLQLREGRLYVSNLELQINMRECDCNVFGLYVNDELSEDISDTISEGAPDFLEEYQDEVSEYVGRIARKFINKILRNYTPGNLLSMIGG